MRKITVAALVVRAIMVICWLTACHSFSTVKESPDVVTKTREIALNGDRINGLVYYLPWGRIRITGDFKSGGDGGSPSGAAKSAAVRASAGEPFGGDATAPKNFVVTIAADIEADPSARYYLKPNRNYFYDDDIKLSVNAKHLLSSGNATAEDQTARIISTSASIAATALGKPPSGLSLKQQQELEEEEAEKLPKPETINGLLLLIQDAINRKKAALDTTLPSAALFELAKVLPSQPEGEAFLKVLSRENFVSLGTIMNLLKLYPLKERINLSNAGEFWPKLIGAISGEGPGQKYVQPRPFSVVFDPVAHGTSIGTTCNVPVCDDPGGCGLRITISEERQPELAKLNKIWEGKNKDTAYGIVFRAVKPYRVTVESVPGTSFYIRESRLVMLPDTRCDHTLVLDYSRLAFVKKTTNVGFVDGIPQNFAQTTPSSVLGFLAIPKGIIQAIVPLSPGITGPPGGVQAPGIAGTTAAPPAPSSTPGL